MLNHDQQVALRIQDIICSKGLVQRAVAERAGFTPNQFCDMLKGRKTLKASYIPDIARAMGVPSADLLPEKWD